MKKNFVWLILLLTFCITGCSTLGKDPNRIEECDAPGVFDNLDDFYTFATTASRDPAMYSYDWTAQNISWYPNVDAEVFLKLEDMFPDEKIVENLYKIRILGLANYYEYEFNNGINVVVEYNQERFPTSTKKVLSQSEDTVYKNEDDAHRFSFTTDDKIVYVKPVNGVTAFRQRTGNVCYFTTYIDGYRLSISARLGKLINPEYSSIEELMEDPQNHCFAAFFDDAELEEAVEMLKTCIANKKAE